MGHPSLGSGQSGHWAGAGYEQGPPVDLTARPELQEPPPAQEPPPEEPPPPEAPELESEDQLHAQPQSGTGPGFAPPGYAPAGYRQATPYQNGQHPPQPRAPESAAQGLAAASVQAEQAEQAEQNRGSRRGRRAAAPPHPAAVYTGTSADLRDQAPTAPERMLAERGWRARVRRWTFGLIKPKASPEEVAEAHWRALATSEWSRPMTVLLANPKGGSGKTSSAVGISATLGMLRGGGVLDWDNNETFGTAGIRTAAGRFQTTVIDLLTQLEHFETHIARKGELNAFIRNQADGNFHVLASDEDPGRMDVLGQEEFDRIHAVLARYYDVMIIDTGNNSRARNFVAAAACTDQLVIPVQWAQDSVETAGRLIDQLHKAGLSDLVARAVVVVSHDGRGSAGVEKIAAWREWFQRTCAAVFEVPFDPHLAERSQISYSKLAEPTKRAYLAVAAGIAQGLNTIDQYDSNRFNNTHWGQS